MKRVLVVLGILLFITHTSQAQWNTNANGDVYTNSKVGIGSQNPDSRLTVNGRIHASAVKLTLEIPADYVFQKYYTGESVLQPGYTVLSLDEVESFIRENHHLPGIPSAKELREEGMDLAEMNNLLLQKIEELTLYVLEQEKLIQQLINEEK
ncbi:hypothetical protein [Sinomicrobium sp.]